jgi:hypothetical protein
MSINPSKYIKLSTEPWTGNGIREPIQNLILEAVPTDPLKPGSVSLTESNNKLLVNGVELTGGGSEVLSIGTTSFPNSILTVSPTTGSVTIGTTNAGAAGLQTLTVPPGNNLQATGTTEVTLSCASTGYLYALVTESYDLRVTPPVGDVVVSTYADISTPLVSVTGPATSVLQTSCFSLPTGVYLLEIEIVSNPSSTENHHFSFNTLFRKNNGVCYIGSANINRPAALGDNGAAVANYIFDSIGQNTIFTYVNGLRSPSGSEISSRVFRIL